VVLACLFCSCPPVEVLACGAIGTGAPLSACARGAERAAPTGRERHLVDACLLLPPLGRLAPASFPSGETEGEVPASA
jgi:hypothetical protein